MLAAVVFDFDGLIVDTEWPEYHSIAEQFATHGLPYPPQRWVHVIGASWNVDWVSELALAVDTPVDRDAITAARRSRARELRAGMAPLPGVIELLDALTDAGIALAVASSSPRSWVEGHLRELGLFDRFRLTRCLDDVAAAKPAPDLFVAACAGLGVAPGRSVALEDSAHGVTAARGAGMRTVAVPNRLTRYLDLSAADLVVESLAHVDVARLQALVASPPS